MEHTENLTADRLPIGTYHSKGLFLHLLEQKKYLLCIDESEVSTCRIAMLGSGRQLDFEPIREHEPLRGGADRIDKKNVKIRHLSRCNPPPFHQKLHNTFYFLEEGVLFLKKDLFVRFDNIH